MLYMKHNGKFFFISDLLHNGEVSKTEIEIPL